MDKKNWCRLGPFTVFDLETTGMSAVNDRIVEIAAIRIDCDGALTRFQSLVNPGRRIPAAAVNVHRITDAMVADSPPFPRVGRDFLELAADSTLVAHNARFDLAFLQESLHRGGLPIWKGKTLDSLRLLRRTHSNLPSYSLQNLRKVFALVDSPENCTAHRAAADVEWTMQILGIALSEALRLSASE